MYNLLHCTGFNLLHMCDLWKMNKIVARQEKRVKEMMFGTGQHGQSSTTDMTLQSWSPSFLFMSHLSHLFCTQRPSEQYQRFQKQHPAGRFLMRQNHSKHFTTKKNAQELEVILLSEAKMKCLCKASRITNPCFGVKLFRVQ